MTNNVTGEMWVPKNPKKRKYICLWEMPNGRYLANEEGDLLVAESKEPFNLEVENKMKIAASYYGFPEGKPKWLPGRKVSRGEYEHQKGRLKEGLIPDEFEEQTRLEEGEL